MSCYSNYSPFAAVFFLWLGRRLPRSKRCVTQTIASATATLLANASVRCMASLSSFAVCLCQNAGVLWMAAWSQEWLCNPPKNTHRTEHSKGVAFNLDIIVHSKSSASVIPLWEIPPTTDASLLSGGKKRYTLQQFLSERNGLRLRSLQASTNLVSKQCNYFRRFPTNKFYQHTAKSQFLQT